MFYEYSMTILAILIVADLATVGSQSLRAHENRDQPDDKEQLLEISKNNVKDTADMFSDYDDPILDMTGLTTSDISRTTSDYLLKLGTTVILKETTTERTSNINSNTKPTTKDGRRNQIPYQKQTTTPDIMTRSRPVSDPRVFSEERYFPYYSQSIAYLFGKATEQTSKGTQDIIEDNRQSTASSDARETPSVHLPLPAQQHKLDKSTDNGMTSPLSINIQSTLPGRFDSSIVSSSQKKDETHSSSMNIQSTLPFASSFTERFDSTILSTSKKKDETEVSSQTMTLHGFSDVPERSSRYPQHSSATVQSQKDNPGIFDNIQTDSITTDNPSDSQNSHLMTDQTLTEFPSATSQPETAEMKEDNQPGTTINTPTIFPTATILLDEKDNFASYSIDTDDVTVQPNNLGSEELETSPSPHASPESTTWEYDKNVSQETWNVSSQEAYINSTTVTSMNPDQESSDGYSARWSLPKDNIAMNQSLTASFLLSDHTTDLPEEGTTHTVYGTTMKDIPSEESPQRVEYNEDDNGDIYWHCPPMGARPSRNNNISYSWYKLSDELKIIHLNRNNTNIMELKSPSHTDEGRYACISDNSGLFVPSQMYMYQLIILKTKWIDIGDEKNVSVFFRQNLILNCPHGDIRRNGLIPPFRCSSRTTVIDYYPVTSVDVYSCSNSPNETTKLYSTNSSSNCSLSLVGCPASTEKDNVVNFRRCTTKTNDSVRPWPLRRCPGKTFIRFYYDSGMRKCLPFETNICSRDYYSFASMEQCEDNCYLIRPEIQRCFHAQNTVDNEMCGASMNGRYLVTYNIVTNECQWFFRREGCNISQNVFSSVRECTQTCIQNKQQIRMDLKKACTNVISRLTFTSNTRNRWVYMTSTDECQEREVSLTGDRFVLSFTTIEGCHMCKQESNKDICFTRPENGQCKRQEIMWHFDYSIGRCIRVLDGGCGDSLNRFSSIRDCSYVCAEHIASRKATSITAYSTLNAYNSTTTSSTTESVKQTNVKRRLHRGLPIISTTTNEPIRPTIIPRSFEVSRRMLEREPCYGRALIGTCDHGINKQNYDLIRYTFVPEYGQCHRVRYSGCLSDENLFDNSNDCKSACEYRLFRTLKSKRCQIPYTNNCAAQIDSTLSANTTRYYYNVADKKCTSFKSVDAPRCLRLYFTSSNECERLCRPIPPSEEILQNKCFGNVVFDNSSCQSSEKIPLWFYMRSIDQCVQYFTCPVVLKGNVFAKKSECEDSCQANNIFTVCSLPLDAGMGNDISMKFYFDIKRRKCGIFPYKGSMGNLNRFQTWDECFETCVKSMLDMDFGPQSPPLHDPAPTAQVEYQGTATNVTTLLTETDREYCYEAHKYGACSHIQPQIYVMKYYYNSYRANCEPYLFSGCGAISRNSFDHQDVCDRMCTARIQRPMAQRCLLKTHQCLNSSMLYWRYSAERGVCELFPSCTKSVPSSDALFTDEGSCLQMCIPTLPSKKDLFDICHLPPAIANDQECASPSKRWFYDREAGTCLPSTVCPSYGNNFPSFTTCQQWCLPRDPQDVCKLPQDRGPCTSNSSVYFFFDWENQQCRRFSYGGCLGNRNRFSSLKDCNTVCSVRRRCNIKTRTIGCRIQIPDNPPIYSYNSTANICQKINETVCGNFFEFYPSEGQCQQDCVVTEEARSLVFSAMWKMPSVLDLRCKDSLKFNNYPICLKTQDWLPRYYYDEYKDECSFFYYNGCDGLEDSGNRFSSFDLCQQTCHNTLTTSLLRSTTVSSVTAGSTSRQESLITMAVCPKQQHLCQSLITERKPCQTDNDCTHNYKCCGCLDDGSLTFQCIEPLGCMLSRYGCCANSDIAAVDISHSNCIKTPLKIIPFGETKMLDGTPYEFYLECLMTGDPRPTITWIHLETKRTFDTVVYWDLTRPVWSGTLRVNNSMPYNGLWLCRGTNDVSEDNLEVMVQTSQSDQLYSDLRLYDDASGNASTRYVSLGTSIIIRCPIYGAPRPTVEWFFNNSLVTDRGGRLMSRERSLYVTNFDHGNYGWWTCVALQNTTTMVTFTVALKVSEPLRIMHSPHGNVIKAALGQRVVLYCNVIGTPTPSVTWSLRRDDVVRNLSSSSTIDGRIFVIERFEDSSRGDYLCKANNDVSDDRVTLTVTLVDESDILVHPAGFHFTGDNITLDCPANPGEKIHYVTWKKDNVEMASRDWSLSFVLNSKLDSGFYTCQHGGRTYQTLLYVHNRPVD